MVAPHHEQQHGCFRLCRCQHASRRGAIRRPPSASAHVTGGRTRVARVGSVPTAVRERGGRNRRQYAPERRSISRRVLGPSGRQREPFCRTGECLLCKSPPRVGRPLCTADSSFGAISADSISGAAFHLRLFLLYLLCFFLLLLLFSRLSRRSSNVPCLSA